MTKEKRKTICERFNCSECCNPVKVKHLSSLGQDIDIWKERDGLWAPKDHVDTVKLRTYDCDNFDNETGLCKDYKNRPNICRNTECRAFDVDDVDEQKRIIKKIKGEEFIKFGFSKLK